MNSLHSFTDYKQRIDHAALKGHVAYLDPLHRAVSVDIKLCITIPAKKNLAGYLYTCDMVFWQDLSLASI